jgi:hypothetical protein
MPGFWQRKTELSFLQRPKGIQIDVPLRVCFQKQRGGDSDQIRRSILLQRLCGVELRRLQPLTLNERPH